MKVKGRTSNIGEDEHLRSLAKIRMEFLNITSDYLNQRGFYFVTIPMLTKTIACENHLGKETFSVRFFDDILYLSQSGQFYLENFVYHDMDVYTIMPSFRKEISDSRHLCEFLHLEVEKRGHFEDLINFIEKMVAYIINALIKECYSEIAEYRIEEEIKSLEKQIKKSFQRIRYEEALNLLNKEHTKEILKEDEILLTKKSNNFVFITHFPKDIATFHYRSDPQNSKLVLNFNLLFPGYGEIIDGGERIKDRDELIEKIVKSGRNVEDYEWYLELRELKNVSHIGFGMGVDRFIQWLLNLPHIKYAIHFPRLNNLVKP
jgi:asparaginyl-tRNA synthetase